jgi:UDP-sulfoquinovose synthase
MRVLILGGDGYLGWPLAMHLAARGHKVTVADNYLRRELASEHKVEALFQPPSLPERCRIYYELTGHQIDACIGDLCDWNFMASVVSESKPESIIHLAEQPSAPYSMLNRQAAMLTLTNNLTVTANMIHAVHEIAPDAHVVKLGTMGEYGTPNIDIEEGWLNITHKGRSDRFLFPRQAGSNYHTTKIMDTDYLWFYVRTWKLAVTDLMQGPVYGIFTRENRLDSRLLSHFAYDEIFGTVLNRFVVQAVIGYPLTVYGKGGQTRGYLNIVDTLNCIQLTIEKPAERGELRVLNQFVETFSVNDLASRVVRAAKVAGFDARIKPLENPRIEKEDHYYNPVHTGLIALGLQPTILTQDILVEMIRQVADHREQIDRDKIFRNIQWA